MMKTDLCLDIHPINPVVDARAVANVDATKIMRRKFPKPTGDQIEAVSKEQRGRIRFINSVFKQQWYNIIQSFDGVDSRCVRELLEITDAITQIIESHFQAGQLEAIKGSARQRHHLCKGPIEIFDRVRNESCHFLAAGLHNSHFLSYGCAACATTYGKSDKIILQYET